MEAWFQDEQTTLFQGDSLEVLRLLPDCSVQCVVTSPPYWALRDYGVEGQLGLEPTPEQYIANMVDVFREVRRVLRDDGTLWLNCGDSYFNETSKSTTSLSREQAAWIASLIDGEGCIQIHRQKRESVADSFQLDISVGMMDKEMCVHAHQITGLGSYSVQARGVHDWSVRGQQAAKLLKIIYPWLLIKKRQAALGIMLCEDIQDKAHSKKNPVTGASIAYRALLQEACSKCNQRQDDCSIKIVEPMITPTIESTLKPKDLVGIPWLLAFALRADGWYLRQDIIWHKASPMPESVKDRCTKAHEYIFLLTKSGRYFYDAIGSQEETTGNAHSRGNGLNPKAKSIESGNHKNRPKQNDSFSAAVSQIVSTRNMRSVWKLASFPLKSAHFAAYPPELVRRCLSAGVSEKGCCLTCGKPHVRKTESRRMATRPGNNAKQHVCSNWQTGKGSHSTLSHNSKDGEHPKNWKADNFDPIGQRSDKSPNRDSQRHITETVTVGWQQSCDCPPSEPVPCVVLDPFHGAGTTWKVCQRLGLRYIGIELNHEYLKLSAERPSVHFPHERAKKKSSKRKKNQQMEIKFHD